MKTVTQPIPLKTTTSESRFIKSTALFAFRGLRTLVEAAKEVPGLVSQAASDISDAWEESSRPKQ